MYMYIHTYILEKPTHAVVALAIVTFYACTCTYICYRYQCHVEYLTSAHLKDFMLHYIESFLNCLIPRYNYRFSMYGSLIEVCQYNINIYTYMCIKPHHFYVFMYVDTLCFRA